MLELMQTTHHFSNEKEDFFVKISLSQGEIIIMVSLPKSNRLISMLELQRVEKFEKITSDNRNS